jgi:hypothetical protein
MIDKKKEKLESTLAYVKQKIHGLVASKGAGHFPKEYYVCVTIARVRFPWHAIM